MTDQVSKVEEMRLFQNIFSSTHDCIFLIDNEYRYLLVNDTYLKLNNKSRGEVVGRTVAELVGQDVFDLKIKSRLDHCLSDNITRFQEWFEFEGAGRRFMDITFLPYRNDKKEIVGVVVNGSDITDLAFTLDAYHTAEKQLKLMSRAGNIGLWDWDLDTNKVYFTPEYKSQIGYGEFEISNDYSEWESRVHPDDLERTKARVRSFIEKPWPEYTNEFRFRHKDGSYRWIMATASLQYGEENRPKRMMGAHIDITERKQKEDALRESEQILHKAQKAAKIGSWWYDPQTMMPQWTDEMFRIFGLEPGTPPPSFTDHQKYIHPDDWDMFEQSVSRAVTEGLGYNIEMRIVWPDGTVRYTNSICDPQSAADGTVNELVGTLQDITERKAAERLSQVAHKKYNDLFESIRDAILVADSDRTIIDCNQALLDLFGYAKEELLGRKTQFLYEGEAQFKEMGATINKHMEDKSFTAIINYQKKSSEVFTGETNAFYLKDDIGNIYGMIGLIRDISEKLAGEKRLRENEARFRSMIENLFDAVMVISQEGIIRFANRAACTLFDRSLQDLVDSSFGFPIAIDKTHEIDIIQNSGTLRHAEIKVAPADWGDEEVYLASIRDTTATVLAKMEREKFQESLQQLQRIEAIGTLAGGIAHDFNNILTPILGFTELAQEHTRDDEFTADCLSEVYQSAMRARDLVAQILAFSRQSKRTYKPILVEPIVREVLKLIRSAIPTFIEIEQDIRSRGMIIGDDTEIHQILMNLCTNAKHAMEESGGKLYVMLHDLKIKEGDRRDHPELQTGRYIHLRVGDSGCGMERAVLEKIFEPYYTTKDKDKGTGLGLSVVHGIVTNHGGVISAESVVGKGTTFDVYLPRSAAIQEGKQVTEEELETGVEHILMVDDENSVLKLNARILENLGYRVTTRVSSFEALQFFDEKYMEIDLLLTDMTMPGMTGDILAEKCMAIKPDLPVVMATGFSEKMTKEKAKQVGITEFLLKPTTKTQMAAAIRSALNNAQRVMEEKTNVS